MFNKLFFIVFALVFTVNSVEAYGQGPIRNLLDNWRQARTERLLERSARYRFRANKSSSYGSWGSRTQSYGSNGGYNATSSDTVIYLQNDDGTLSELPAEVKTGPVRRTLGVPPRVQAKPGCRKVNGVWVCPTSSVEVNDNGCDNPACTCEDCQCVDCDCGQALAGKAPTIVSTQLAGKAPVIYSATVASL